MPQRLVIFINWTENHLWDFVSGVFFVFLSYFAELKGAFHVMFAAFLLDLVLGIWASKRIRKERFSMDKFFVAILRMCISYSLVMLLYAMDKEMKQETVSLANITAWMVTGSLIYSAAKNGFQITSSKIFLKIMELINKKVQDNTGMDIEEQNDGKS